MADAGDVASSVAAKIAAIAEQGARRQSVMVPPLTV